MRLIVIGIGQTMRGDDAAGVEAVRHWQQSYPATAARRGVNVEFSELPGLGLLDLVEGFDAALLVDAVQTSRSPGTIYRMSPDDLASFGSDAKSAHGWGVAETLALDRQLNPSHHGPRIRLVGIEAAQLDLGRSLSPAVDKALSSAADAIEAEVQSLLAQE